MKIFLSLIFLFSGGPGAGRVNSEPPSEHEAKAPHQINQGFRELDRQEIDRLQRQYEDQYLSGVDLGPFAAEAFQVNDPTAYFLIQKTQKLGTKDAVQATLIKFAEKWQKQYPGGPNGPREEAKQWILSLCRQYPENGYLAYIYALWLYSNLRETEANEIALKVFQQLDHFEIPKAPIPSLQDMKTVEGKREVYKERQSLANKTDTLHGLHLTIYLLINGYYQEVGQTLDKMDALVREVSVGTPSPLQPFRGLIALLKGENEKLLQAIQESSSSNQEFINACDSLLPDRKEDVLGQARKRAKEDPKQLDLQLNLAQCLWRTGKIDEAEQIIEPLLKANNQPAMQWWQGVKSLKAGCPAEFDERVLVRIEFPLGTGTGFFVSSDGFVVTAAHNVAMAKKQRQELKVIDHAGKAWPVDKINVHAFSDLAVLKIKKRDGPFLGISQVKRKPDERVLVVGFPLRSLIPFHHRPQSLGSVEGADDVILTGMSLRGLSGAPILRGNSVMAVRSSSLGGILIHPVEGMIAEMRGWPDDQDDNFESIEKEGNYFFDPWLVWVQVFKKGFATPDENQIPEELRQDFSFTNYIKNKEIKRYYDGFKTTKGSIPIILEKSKEGADSEKWIEKQELSPALVALLRNQKSFFRSKADPDTIYRGMEDLHRRYPNLSPAIAYMAFYHFLKSFGNLDEYTQRMAKGSLSEKDYKMGGEKIVDSASLRECIRLMEAYDSLDPDLRWDSLSGLTSALAGRGIDNFFYFWPSFQTKLPVMLADAEGRLDDTTVRKLAEEGNPLAMAILAQNLSKTDEKISGFSYALRSAEAGEPAGQAVLARYFLSGIGTVKNEAKGFEWALKSAEAGHPQGNLFAGICLVQGLGVTKDPPRGFQLIRRAALGGDKEAAYILANPRLAETGGF